ncbi:MAG TPA: asparaginase [Streptosporangiaceae bacterium]|jgi:L-asparaginase|nr:asparaginase [Streptosporangiaceae bacterium]
MRTSPVVTVGSLGGTITMTAATGPHGVMPSLAADDLLASLPGLPPAIEVRTETLRTVPGASLEFADLADALLWAHRAVDGGTAGVVLAQGTDTLEETSYLLDLYWDRAEPLVMTGAMRPPQQPSADGPANLLGALVTAAAPESRGLGVLAVLNDEVHAASRVRKCDTTALGAFSSAPFGPLARIHEGQVVYANRPLRPQPLPGPVPARTPKVALLEASLGDGGELVALASEAGFDGIVLSAFGAGHTSAAMATMVAKAAERIPVVLASRAGAGSVLKGTYGFAGSERDLLDHGAVPAGWLDPRKARILLGCLLAAGEPVDRIRAEFARRGGRIFGSSA